MDIETRDQALRKINVQLLHLKSDLGRIGDHSVKGPMLSIHAALEGVETLLRGIVLDEK